MRIPGLARSFAVLVFAIVPPVLGAAPIPSPTKSPAETPAQKLRKELEIAVTIDIAEQPLSQAITQLREQTKVNLVLDKFSITTMGVDPDSTPVSLKIKQGKLRTGLHSMLSQWNLTYAIVGDTLLITTEEMAIYRQMKQRVSVDLTKAELGKALRQLGKENGVNILVDPKLGKEAQTAITLELDDVPLDTAVRLIAESAGLKTARVGNVLMVTTKATAASLQADPELTPKPVPGGEGVPPGTVAPPIGGGAGQAVPAVPPVQARD